MKTIEVTARRWFQESSGNTYHSVSVYVDGKFIDHNPFAYGYDDAYLVTAGQLLEQHGCLELERSNRGTKKGLKSYCLNRGINLFTEVTNVSRKRDL